QLAVCRLSAQWPAWRSLDDADPVSPPERTRSVRLPEGRAHAPADAEGQRPGRAAAAQLGARRQGVMPVRLLWARSVAALFAATGAGFVDAYAGQRRGHLGCNVTCGMMSRI